MGCPSCGCIEKVQKAQGKHIGEYCADCDKWLRWIPQDWKDFIWPIGAKHKGQKLSAILLNDQPYLEWAAQNVSGSVQRRAQQALDSLGSSKSIPKDPDTMDMVDRISRHSQPRSEDNDVPW
jgi:hypothetical protein